MSLENKTEFARAQMVAQQVRGWEVHDDRVLGVLAEVPREHFVPEAYRSLAFAETAIPLAHGQFMMPPSLEGKLLQALELGPADEVLEIGTGSGFVTACLSRLAGSVTSIEIFPGLTASAGERLAELGIENVTLLTGDATHELPEGRFDAVAVTGSLPLFITRYCEILQPGGRLFVVVGSPPVMEAQLVTRGEDDQPQVRSLFETNVPPLVNAPSPPAFRF